MRLSIYPIMFPMFLVQEKSHIPDGVPVPGHTAGAGKTHGNDPEMIYVRVLRLNPYKRVL